MGYKFRLPLLIIIILLLKILANPVEVKSIKNEVPNTVRINVDDSTKLATDIYLPSTEGPFPTILIRSPYNKKNSSNDANKFTDLGYAVVVQDTRGKFDSDGIFYPFKYERKDGLATIQWIRSQPWCNGKIAGWGGSYLGYTQWAIADQLDLITPVVTTGNMYEALYPSGIFSLATAFNWGLTVDSKTVNNIPPEKIAGSYTILPLSKADDSTYQQNNFLDDWLSHPFEDAYWGSINHRSVVSCPIYSVAGWYDIFLMAQIEDFRFQGTQRHPHSRMIIGPYAHGQIQIETDFKEHSNPYENWKDVTNFLASHLIPKKQQEPFFPSNTTAPYSLFIIHRNEWYSCQEWPPKMSTYIPYNFNSNGRLFPNSFDLDSAAVEYSYNPMEPFSSIGGSFLGTGVGPAFQNPNKNRQDQVIFEGEPLNNPLILGGPIEATIYVTTNTPSTDFFVSLQEVRPDGKIVNIQEGGKKIFSDASCLPRPQKIEVSLWATAYQVNSNHKIRVAISSSLFPRYNRNLNLAKPIFEARNSEVAKQTIFFGKNYPSHIRLPVLNLDE